MPIVFEAAAVTASLFGSAYLVQSAIGYLIGMRSAAKRRPSKTAMLLGVSLQGISIITLSFLAVFVFAYCFRLHPTGPWAIRLPWTYGESLGRWLLDLCHRFWLPFSIRVFGTCWQTAYSVEKLVLGTTAEEHVEAARARGTSERRIRFGIIPRTNAPALVTLAVQGFFVTVWGSVILEQVFSVPGLGSLFIHALQHNDRFLVAAILVSLTLVFQFSLFLLDVTYGFLDPRIRVGVKARVPR
jgi:peptide/nickel transport system permease protein